MRASRVRRTVVGAVVALGLTLAAVGCSGDDEPGPKPSPRPSASSPAPVKHLTFGVWGAQNEINAFRTTVDEWNRVSEGPVVKLRVWDTHQDFRRSVEAGADLPDVFLTSRTDLRWLLDNDLTQPVDALLDDRGVDFGDGYSRDSLQAFSVDDRLQCMPYGLSPMVIYYNTDLVDFERMQARGLDAPEPDATSWSLDQFAAAARYASRPVLGTTGVHIDPTLAGLSPFIESGGGSVFDDNTDPTSLSFASDDSRSALDRTLQVLRDPRVTLDEQEVEEQSALRRFEDGTLAMIAGYRSLVPPLREVPGLDWDILPMPVLDGSATIGDISGLCLARDAASTPAAADFMVHELSAPSVTRVTRTGYLAPANLEVALSDIFLQPGREPERSSVFNSSLRSMDFGPLIDTVPALDEAIEPYLRELVYGTGSLDLDLLTERIDETSVPILDPPEPSESPSASPSDS